MPQRKRGWKSLCPSLALQVGHWAWLVRQVDRQLLQNTWPHTVDTSCSPLFLMAEKVSRQIGQWRLGDCALLLEATGLLLGESVRSMVQLGEIRPGGSLGED